LHFYDIAEGSVICATGKQKDMSNLNIARRASGDCCFEQSVERGEVLTTNFRDIVSEQASCERSFRDAEVMR